MSKPHLPDEIREQAMVWFDEGVSVEEIRYRVQKMTDFPEKEVKKFVAGVKSQHTKGFRPRKSPEYTKGHVYFIRGEDTGKIKIGFAVDPEIRLRDLQTGSSEKLSLIKFIEGTQEKETEIQNRFKKYRIHGEWFEPAEELVEFIENL